MRNPVMKDDRIEDFTIRIKGHSRLMQCPAKCGCNVFHKPDDTNLNRYACNGCKKEFETV